MAGVVVEDLISVSAENRRLRRIANKMAGLLEYVLNVNPPLPLKALYDAEAVLVSYRKERRRGR